MTRERTNTGFDLKPVGGYVLEVEKVFKKQIGKDGGKQYTGYEWLFEIRQSDVDLDESHLKMFMFKSQMGDLLRALGAKELAKDDFEWDTDEVKGKIIQCHLIHQDINGKMREGLIEIKPFTDKLPEKQAVDHTKAWDE